MRWGGGHSTNYNGGKMRVKGHIQHQVFTKYLWLMLISQDRPKSVRMDRLYVADPRLNLLTNSLYRHSLQSTRQYGIHC